MKISYNYKGKNYDDVRDITNNNKLEPDWDTIFESYLPFQIFIQGKTIFKDLTVCSDAYYNPEEQENPSAYFETLLEKNTNEYLDRNNFCKDKVIAAVSGGTDSSLVALSIKPDVIYSGYYDDPEYDEIQYSSLVAETIGAKHIKIKITESDFLDHMQEVVEAIGVPIGGLGSVTEYITLKKAKELTGADTVLFGNGGDEIFLSYFFCHFVKDMLENRENPTIAKYMQNFTEAERKTKYELIDFAILSILNRADRSIYNSNFVFETFLPNLAYPDYIDRLLIVTINWILPSLLHLNQQMCKAQEVSGLNPLSNKDLFKYARSFNSPMSNIPKVLLRHANPNMPKEISERTDKQGFPIPIDKWDEVSLLLGSESGRFLTRQESLRRILLIPRYPSFRYRWAASQVEMFLRKHGI